MKDKYKVHQQQNDNVGTNMYFDLNKAQYIFDQEKRRKHIQDTYEHILTNVSNFISSLLTYVYSHLWRIMRLMSFRDTINLNSGSWRTKSQRASSETKHTI